MSEAIIASVMDSNFYACERGNTLLVSEPGNFVAWLELDDGYYLEISWVSENYPSLHVSPIHLTEEEIVSHINKQCGDYYIRKCHFKGVRYCEADNSVVGDDLVEDGWTGWKVTE